MKKPTHVNWVLLVPTGITIFAIMEKLVFMLDASHLIALSSIGADKLGFWMDEAACMDRVVLRSAICFVSAVVQELGPVIEIIEILAVVWEFAQCSSSLIEMSGMLLPLRGYVVIMG